MWTSTYGIWAEELAPLGLTGVLARRWSACAVYAGERRIDLQREYGLIDNAKLQAHLLARLARAATTWHTGRVAEATQLPDRTLVSTRSGAEYAARVVIDASGHAPVLVTRPRSPRLAYQTAYGIVGRFSAPPVSPGQMVLMDYRSGHLDADERREPPTFLYAMDLGESRFFVEETSLAHTPPAPLDALAQRLHKRLAWQGVRVEEVEHVERCVFPMNRAAAALADQPVLGFGAQPAWSILFPAIRWGCPALRPSCGASACHSARRRSALAREPGANRLAGIMAAATATTARALPIWPSKRLAF